MLNTTSSLNIALSQNTSLRGKVLPAKVVDKMLMVYEPMLQFYKYSEAPVSAVDSTSVIWIKPQQLTLSPAQATLEEGVTPESTNMNLTYIETATVQYGLFVSITDILAKKAQKLALMEKAAELVARNMGRIMDRVVQDEVLDNATQRIYAATSSGGTRPIQRSSLAAGNIMFAYDFVTMWRILASNNVPVFDDGHYRMIIHPNVLASLKTETTIGAFLNLNQYSRPEKIDNGVLQVYSNIAIAQSSFVKTYASTIPFVYPTVAFGQEAYGASTLQPMEVIIHPFGSGGTANPLNQIMTVGAKTAFSAKTLHPDGIIVLESAGQA